MRASSPEEGEKCVKSKAYFKTFIDNNRWISGINEWREHVLLNF